MQDRHYPDTPIRIPATEAGFRFLDTYERIFNEVNAKSGGALVPLSKSSAPAKPTRNRKPTKKAA